MYSSVKAGIVLSILRGLQQKQWAISKSGFSNILM